MASYALQPRRREAIRRRATVSIPWGNRLSSLGVASYAYNNSNELASTSAATYTYDNNGNTLTKTDSTGTTTYAWDFDNRLTSVTLPGSGGTVSFKYDPFGRRIYKSSLVGTSIFAYDGDNLAEEANSAGAVVARYSQGLDIDEPLAMLRGGATNFYEADGLGSITSLSNTAAAIAQTYAYDSFGKQTASSGSLTNPFRYTAREIDTETNLYDYRARYYDPSVGRFIGEDPIIFEGGVNFYRYVSNRATSFRDPLGLCPADALTPCRAVVPTDGDARAILDTVLGEASSGLAGRQQYEDGDSYGHPSGPIITGDELDAEQTMITDTILNRARNNSQTPTQVVSAPRQFLGYRHGANLQQAMASSDGSAACEKLLRAVGVYNIENQLGISDTTVTDFRGIDQVTPGTTSHFIRQQGDALRLGGTDFLAPH